ncbi:hypothetical protein JW859_00895 [bacterium]|nr:hypothetical protein [bacterium]
MGIGLLRCYTNPAARLAVCYLLLLTCGLLASCGGHALAPEPADSLAPEHADGFSLPDPASLKLASLAPGDLVRDGSQFVTDSGYPVQHAGASDQACQFDPDWTATTPVNSDLAVACYAFGLADFDKPPTVSFEWEATGNAGGVWIGLSDFTDHCWEWHALPETQALRTSLEHCIDGETSTLLVAVVIADDADWQLRRVRIGALGSLYGHVLTAGELEPIPDVVVKVEGNETYTAITDYDGYWQAFDVLPGDYSVSAHRIGWEFDPATRAASVGCTEQFVDNFSGSQLATNVVDGYIYENFDGGPPMPWTEVQIRWQSTADGGFSVWSDEAGYWTADLPNGDYYITPHCIGYQFTPSQAAVTVADAPQTVPPFIATQKTLYNIGGYIYGTDGTTPLSNIQVNTYSDEDSFWAQTDASGHWSTQAYDGDYTVEPYEYGWGFTPPTREVTVAGSDLVVDPFIGAELGEFDIEGYVYLADGATPLGDLSVFLSGDTGWYYATTNSSGYYHFSDVFAGDYEVCPNDPRYTYVPEIQQFTLSENIMLTPFLATALPTYTVDGYIYKPDEVTPVEGATVAIWSYISDMNLQGQTDANGHWAIPGVPSGFFNVTPDKIGYTFEPYMQSIEVADSNVTCDDFIGDCPEAYQLYGYVYELDGTTPVPGVKMMIYGDYNEFIAYTDAGGQWSVDEAFEDSYMIIPTLAPWQFTPEYRDVDVHGADVQVDDFLGEKLLAFTVDGYVYELDSTIGVPDIEIQFSDGDLVYFATTDENGYYSLPIPNGSWQAIPIAGCWDFTPVYQDFVVSGGPQTLEIFYAEPGG